MDKIKEILKKEITKKGHISISRFMEISLFDPNDGYYTKQTLLVQMVISLLLLIYHKFLVKLSAPGLWTS